MTDNCAVCGVEWMSREPTIYGMGVRSNPIIFGMQLLSHHGMKRIKLMFCDKHGNNPGFRNCIRYVNGTNMLQIRNVITNRWRNAEKIGVVV